MDKMDKPLSDWTLGEAREECNKHEGNCGGCPFYRRKKGCRLYSEYDATYWNLEEKPRFTQEEVAVLRHMASVGIVSIEKKSDTHLYWDCNNMGGVMVVPPDFLPNLHPGQSVRLEDVLGANS